MMSEREMTNAINGWFFTNEGETIINSGEQVHSLLRVIGLVEDKEYVYIGTEKQTW